MIDKELKFFPNHVLRIRAAAKPSVNGSKQNPSKSSLEIVQCPNIDLHVFNAHFFNGAFENG